MANETASLVILVDSTGAATATKQLDDMTAAGARAEAATVSMGESAEAASARIKSMVEASLAQANANGIVGESERSLAERAGLRIEATAAQIAATQAAVAAQDAQMASTVGFFGAENAATTAVEADTVATVENTAAKTVNSRTQYELGIMLGEVASGNISRLKRSGAALANSTGLLAKAMTPVGLTILGVAAAAGVLIDGFIKGAEESSILRESIILTGGSAGVTAGQLNQMAVAVGAATHEYGDARTAVELFANSGKVAGQNISELTTLAVNMSTVTGESIDKTTAEIIKMGEKPAETIAKLNEQYHLLTSAQYAHIAALEEDGRTRDAANAAADIANAAMADRTKDVQDNSGWLIEAAHGVAHAWGEAWDAIKGVGRTQDISGQIADIKAQIDAANGSHFDQSGNMVSNNTDDSLVPKLQKQLAELQTKQIADSLNAQHDGIVAGLNQDAIAAQNRLSAFKTPAETHDDAIKKANEDRLSALYGIVDPAQVAVINARADEEVKKANEAYASATKKRVGHAKKDPEEAAFATFQGQVDTLQNSVVGPTDDPALAKYETGIAKLSDELNRYMEKSGDATKGAQLFNEGQQALQKTLDASRAKQKEADDAFDLSYAKKSLALQRSIDDQVNAIGMGTKEAAQTREVTKAYQDQADALAELALRRQEGKLTQDQYDHDVNTVKDATNKNVAAMQDGFKRIDAAQGNWLNGAKKAMQDYADAGQNVAGLTQGFFTNSIDAMGNALANFATTGKLNFKSMVASILSDLAKMEMQIAASKILQSIIGMMAGPSTGSQYTAAGGNGAGDGGYGMMVGTYAKGGAFDATGQITAFASGGVVDGATGFNFAGGAGVMGEAGPEAIMPLSRGSDGKLGIKSSGGNGNVININTSITVDKGGVQSQTNSDSSDAMAKQLAGMMESKAKEVVMRATQPGGILWQKGVGA